jgi:hypothetical protein
VLEKGAAPRLPREERAPAGAAIASAARGIFAVLKAGVLPSS